jgi:hypothetical protein
MRRHLAFAVLLPLLALLHVAGRPALVRADDVDCPRPWVVVVRKDGSVVEGRLVKDIDKGILVEVGARTQLVPDDEIEEVVEDCSRLPPPVAAPLPAPSQPPAPAAPPPPPTTGKKVQKTVLAAEAEFRNNFIGYIQQSVRWAGGGCVSLGCGLCSTGVVFALLTLAYGLTGQTSIQGAVIVAPLLLVIFGMASAVFVASGGGLLLSAQLLDFLRPDHAEPPPPLPGPGPGGTSPMMFGESPVEDRPAVARAAGAPPVVASVAY